MPFRINNIRLSVDAPEDALKRQVLSHLHVPESDLKKWRILRKSLDARSRRNLKFVYSVVAELVDEQGNLDQIQKRDDVDLYSAKPFDDPPPGTAALDERPIIVGSGPAGLLAGYYLAKQGYRPLIIERGQPVKERVSAIRRFDRGGPFEPEDNYLYGEGGAGCFSDGKLTCRVSGPDVDWVLERFVECGGKPALTYEHRPHLGSNKLPMICRNFRRKIEAMGGEYLFGCRLEDVDIQDGSVRGINTSSGYMRTRHLILGIGHSARDTYQMLLERGVPLEAKTFQLGLRIEQPQEQVNQHKYGHERYLDLLGAADYSLVAHGKQDLFTFCMCAGGIVIPSISEPEMFCSNGMSNSRHGTPFANSGLVVTMDSSEFGSTHPLAGVEIQRKYEALAFELAGRNYLCPIQTAQDFLSGREPDPNGKIDSSYARGTKPTQLAQLLPPSILAAVKAGLPIMDEKWRGQFLKNATLVGPEMRGSSPVRIVRDRETRQCPNIRGFYPIGEGAGYAGGIVTAAIDGLRSAREIVRHFSALESADQV